MPGQAPLVVSPTLRIPAQELVVNYIHASGPGGQNVNKVATAAQLRFDVDASQALPDAVKTRLRAIAGKRISQDGILVITARRFRSQARNREDALHRLKVLLTRAARAPRTRIATRPSRAERRRRLDAKQRRGRLKASRRRPGPED